jgi:hypothetical protein
VYVGGRTTVEFVNNLFACNSVLGDGLNYIGGVGIDGGGALTCTNNTVTDNSAAMNGGVYMGVGLRGADIFNNIIWGNNGPDENGADLELIASVSTPINLFNNDFDQSPEGFVISDPSFIIDPSNLDDPLFFDPQSCDYHLTAESPVGDDGVVDAGENSAPGLPSTDLDGNPRIVNGTVDMGRTNVPMPARTIRIRPSRGFAAAVCRTSTLTRMEHQIAMICVRMIPVRSIRGFGVAVWPMTTAIWMER